MISAAELRKVPLFSDLGDKALDFLARSVEDIRLVTGEYGGHEGEARTLFVMIEGKAEITKMVNGVETVIAMRLPGDLAGEIPITLGTPLPASVRAVEPSRLLKLDAQVFHTLAAMAPEVAVTVGKAALERMEMLRKAASQPPAPQILLVGPSRDAVVHKVGNFLHRNRISFESFEPDDPALPSRLGDDSPISGPYPAVQMADGTRLVAPTMRSIATLCGLQSAPRLTYYDVVIVGGGPAGLTAAVNAASEGLRTVVVEGFAPGGQAGTSTRIENYPGFPVGVSGDDLASNTLKQAKRLGAEIVVTRRLSAIDPQAMTVIVDKDPPLRTRTVVLAMGVEWRRMGVESVDRFIGSGVYYGAARSDAGLAQGRDVYLIGAGNSAGQAALFFSSHSNSVTLIVRAESLASSMSQYLIDQIATKRNIRVATRSEVVAGHGTERLEAIDVADRRTGATSRRQTEALFVMIGAHASTGWLPPEIVRDSHGFVLTGPDARKQCEWLGEREPYALETSAPGVFAVGDVRSGSVKRVAAAVGEGGMAIAYVHKFLQAH
ncbi:MAG: FAD-dependent oxidoreductase [Burkholderiales bacterium]|nr:FAD-dependent oxidoreductase [Burkholderiales bacterium]